MYFILALESQNNLMNKNDQALTHKFIFIIIDNNPNYVKNRHTQLIVLKEISVELKLLFPSSCDDAHHWM